LWAAACSRRRNARQNDQGHVRLSPVAPRRGNVRKRDIGRPANGTTKLGRRCPNQKTLARSMKDLQDIVHELRQKGVALKATEQPIDTSSAAGKAFLAWRVR